MRVLDLKPFHAVPSDARPSAVRFGSLLQRGPQARDVVADWEEALNLTQGKAYLTPAEALLFEWFLAWDPLAVGSALPARFGYLKTVHVSRQRAVVALHDYARELGWRRPVVQVAALRIGRAYCRALVANEHMTREDTRFQFSGRLGVQTVLLARFVDVPEQELREAASSLERSIAQGNDAFTALEYWLEGQVRIFEKCGDIGALRRAAEHTRAALPGSLPLSLRLQLANVALRLREPSLAGLGRLADLSAALASAGRGRANAIEDVVASRLLIALVEEESRLGLYLPPSAVPILPFDLRRRLAPDLHPFVPRLVTELSAGEFRHEPLARSLAADLLQHQRGTKSASAADLRERIALRYWPTADGGDDRNWLLRSRDGLLLASEIRDDALRSRVLEDLIDRGRATSSTAASALILIAKDVEKNGACRLAGRGGQSNINDLVRAGDVDGLLLEAATEAERSPDLLPQSLGGRSNVTTVGDLYDLAGEMFIFKEVDLHVLEHESARAAKLSQQLVAARGTDELVVCTPRLLRKVPGAPGQGIAVRRFEAGRSARAAVETDPTLRLSLLQRLARNLGWINKLEGLSCNQTGRRDIKSRELGMWLKALGCEDWSGFFEQWWSSFVGIPAALRRDSHLDNWILSDSGAIIAIDLEAQTWRPLAYELAQLTEDGAHLPPDDWETRLAVLDAYGEALGPTIHSASLREPFEASILARAVRHLTMPRDGGRYVAHGIAILSRLADDAGTEGIQELARRALDTFAQSRGGDSVFESRPLTNAKRRRLSKQLAYLLRHSLTQERDARGWVDMAMVAQHIGESVATVFEVATHPDERRFQVNAGAIRALYGHSVQVDIDQKPVRSPGACLYHGTSMDAVDQILLPSGGIRRQSREWVHLAVNPEDAYPAALRKGRPVILAVVTTGLDGLWSASEATVLTHYVPRERVRVAPIASIWESVPDLGPSFWRPQVSPSQP